MHLSYSPWSLARILAANIIRVMYVFLSVSVNKTAQYGAHWPCNGEHLPLAVKPVCCGLWLTMLASGTTAVWLSAYNPCCEAVEDIQDIEASLVMAQLVVWLSQSKINQICFKTSSLFWLLKGAYFFFIHDHHHSSTCKKSQRKDKHVYQNIACPFHAASCLPFPLALRLWQMQNFHKLLDLHNEHICQHTYVRTCTCTHNLKIFTQEYPSSQSGIWN